MVNFITKDTTHMEPWLLSWRSNAIHVPMGENLVLLGYKRWGCAIAARLEKRSANFARLIFSMMNKEGTEGRAAKSRTKRRTITRRITAKQGQNTPC
jgi:hypothetical protein